MTQLANQNLWILLREKAWPRDKHWVALTTVQCRTCYGVIVWISIKNCILDNNDVHVWIQTIKHDVIFFSQQGIYKKKVLLIWLLKMLERILGANRQRTFSWKSKQNITSFARKLASMGFSKPGSSLSFCAGGTTAGCPLLSACSQCSPQASPRLAAPPIRGFSVGFSARRPEVWLQSSEVSSSVTRMHHCNLPLTWSIQKRMDIIYISS